MSPQSFFAATLLALATSTVVAAAPVRVFVLAGQSNMQGKAAASTLRAAIEDTPEDDAFRGLLDADGKWSVREDVRVTFLSNAVRGDQPLYGALTVGFGSQKTGRDDQNRKIPVPGIGPELGIGHVLGDHFEEPVLLIKAAWGGRSVKYNFRSPSSMPDEAQLLARFAQLKLKKPELAFDAWRDGFGASYRDMIDEVRKVTGNLERHVPDFDKEQGYEIAGLIWFQGWNDGVGSGNPEYTEQLAAMVRDVRKDLGVPSLPVVVGELGVDGGDASGWVATFRKQQAAVAALPEFKGNVALAKTAAYWPKPPDLSEKWQEFRKLAKANEAKAKDDPTRIDPGKFYQQNWQQRYKEQLKYTSDKRYHYLGSGECYLRMGQAMGRAMLQLLSVQGSGAR